MKKSIFEKNVDKLIEASNIEATYKGVLSSFIKKSFVGQDPETTRKIIDMFLSPKNMKQISQIIKKVYMANYSPSEIVAMLKFYGSTDGKSVMEKAPRLANEIASQLKLWTEDIASEVMGKIDEIINQKIVVVSEEKIREDDKAFIIDPEEITVARYKFSNNYIREKGWDSHNLTPDQVMEIRGQDGWKNAKKQ